MDSIQPLKYGQEIYLFTPYKLYLFGRGYAICYRKIHQPQCLPLWTQKHWMCFCILTEVQKQFQRLWKSLNYHLWYWACYQTCLFWAFLVYRNASK